MDHVFLHFFYYVKESLGSFVLHCHENNTMQIILAKKQDSFTWLKSLYSVIIRVSESYGP